jgi:hypothetical protein
VDATIANAQEVAAAGRGGSTWRPTGLPAALLHTSALLRSSFSPASAAPSSSAVEEGSLAAAARRTLPCLAAAARGTCAVTRCGGQMPRRCSPDARARFASAPLLLARASPLA